MAAKEIVVKKYVVRLSCGERSLLETLIRKGSNPAQRLLIFAHPTQVGAWDARQIKTGHSNLHGLKVESFSCRFGNPLYEIMT